MSWKKIWYLSLRTTEESIVNQNSFRVLSILYITNFSETRKINSNPVRVLFLLHFRKSRKWALNWVPWKLSWKLESQSILLYSISLACTVTTFWSKTYVGFYLLSFTSFEHLHYCSHLLQAGIQTGKLLNENKVSEWKLFFLIKTPEWKWKFWIKMSSFFNEIKFFTKNIEYLNKY